MRDLILKNAQFSEFCELWPLIIQYYTILLSLAACVLKLVPRKARQCFPHRRPASYAIPYTNIDINTTCKIQTVDWNDEREQYRKKLNN